MAASHTLVNPCCEDEMDVAYVTFTVENPSMGERSMVRIVSVTDSGITDYIEPRLLNRVEARKVWARYTAEGYTRA